MDSADREIMIKPLLQDDAFLGDVRHAAEDRGKLHLWWLGQSGFLVQFEGRHLLLDPYLSDSLTHKYARTDKPHVRMTQRVIDPARLDFIDVVTSSHNHTDHLDADTLGPLMSVNREIKIVIPEANRQFVAERLKIDPARPVGLNAGEAITIGQFQIAGVPAAHEQLSTDERGRHRFMGYVLRAGRWAIYHSGDTVMYDAIVQTLRPFSVDAALLPINGRAPERRVDGNLDGPEAARLAKEIGAKTAVPCHYEMFEFNTASPDEFVRECRLIEQPWRVMKAGERFSLP